MLDLERLVVAGRRQSLVVAGGGEGWGLLATAVVAAAVVGMVHGHVRRGRRFLEPCRAGIADTGSMSITTLLYVVAAAVVRNGAQTRASWSPIPGTLQGCNWRST